MFTTALAGWLAVTSAVTFVVSLFSLPLLLSRIPADYFVRPTPPEASWRRRHPVLRWSLRVLKNLIGVLLLLAGIVMLVTPGQGILTILIGIVLLDLPGKRHLELWLIRRPKVLASVNWIRHKAHKPPLQLPTDC